MEPVAALSPAAISILVLAALAGIAMIRLGVSSEAPGVREGRAGPRTPRERLQAAMGRRGTPEPWVLGLIALLILGILVAPRLLGFTFVFLPLILMNRRRFPRRFDDRRRADPDDADGPGHLGDPGDPS